MKSYINDLLIRHLIYEGEQVHLVTTLYGVIVPNNSLEQHLRVAKCLELMKASTLIKDDFLDKSPLRNSIPSLYSKLGAEEAVLIADILKSSALIEFCKTLNRIHNLRETDKQKCILLFEDVYNTISLGQLEELRAIKSFNIDGSVIKEKKYWRIIKKTTASFIQLPLILGSIMRRSDELIINTLRKYGLYLGLAYQVRDDIIDLIGNTKITGKPMGGDIKEKKMRLAILHCLRNGSKGDVALIKEIYNKRKVSNNDVKNVIKILKLTGSITYCIKKVNYFCNKAIKCLSSINDNSIQKQLEDIANLLSIKNQL